MSSEGIFRGALCSYQRKKEQRDVRAYYDIQSLRKC